MDSTTWFAIVAAVAGGAGFHQRKYGKPAVRKSLSIAMWIVAVIALGICVVVALAN